MSLIRDTGNISQGTWTKPCSLTYLLSDVNQFIVENFLHPISDTDLGWPLIIQTSQSE